LSKYFNYRRPTRKTFDEKYRVLTKSGMVINLETDHQKINAYKKMLREINSNN